MRSSPSCRAQNSLSNGVSWRKFYLKMCAQQIAKISGRTILEQWKKAWGDCVVNKNRTDRWFDLKFFVAKLECWEYDMVKTRPLYLPRILGYEKNKKIHIVVAQFWQPLYIKWILYQMKARQKRNLAVWLVIHKMRMGYRIKVSFMWLDTPMGGCSQSQKYKVLRNCFIYGAL